jgi:hypothetical protein
VQWDTDTGETDNGIFLGSGFHEISGSVTAVKTQDPLVFVGSAFYLTSFEKGGVDPGDQIGATEVEVDGQAIPGSDAVFATFTIGVSSIMGPRVLLDLTAGIGLTHETSDYFVDVSLPIRF